MVSTPADNASRVKVGGMRRSSVLLCTLAFVAAPAAAAAGYQSWAPDPSVRADQVRTAAPVSAESVTGPVIRYRPCAHGATLAHGVCVTHEVQVVVASAAVGPQAPAAPAAPAAPTGSAGGAASGGGAPAEPHAPAGHHAHPGEDHTNTPTAVATAGSPAGPTSGPTASPP